MKIIVSWTYVLRNSNIDCDMWVDIYEDKGEKKVRIMPAQDWYDNFSWVEISLSDLEKSLYCLKSI